MQLMETLSARTLDMVLRRASLCQPVLSSVLLDTQR